MIVSEDKRKTKKDDKIDGPHIQEEDKLLDKKDAIMKNA